MSKESKERLSTEPFIKDLSLRKKFMYFFDKEGYPARQPYASNKLSEEEKAERLVKKAALKEQKQKERAIAKAEHHNKKVEVLADVKAKKNALKEKISGINKDYMVAVKAKDLEKAKRLILEENELKLKFDVLKNTTLKELLEK